MVNLKRIGIGRTAETFITKQGRALKLFYEFMAKDTVEDEYAIAKKVAEVCSCAPAVYGLVKRGERIGIEYELIRGLRLVELFMKYPFRMEALARGMGIMHRKIHEHSVQGFKSAFAVYKESIKHYPYITEEIGSRLLQFIERSRHSTLCHGDYHPDNLLVNEGNEFKVID
jgi:aminoglycoside phosphotransferase (APT) family kinase protein